MTIDLSKIEVTSHSRLGTYEKCGALYQREYIQKIRVRKEADHFLIGTACHKSIEDYYNDQDGLIAHPTDALDPYWRDWLRGYNLGYLLGDLKAVAADISNLWLRASADYSGPDRIRKAGDLVADNPTMTGAWKKAAERLNLNERQETVDKTLRQIDKAFETVSLSNAYATSWEILKGYNDPSCLAAIEFIEFPMSHRVFDETTRQLIDLVNPVVLPRTGVYFNGYIDLVGRLTPELGGGIVLLDHKTTNSVNPPTRVEVGHVEQLLEYSWAWHQLTGEWPTHIGINHLRSGKCVIAPVDRELALDVISRREDLIVAQKHGIFPRREPFGYGSPCLKMRDGKLTETCAHFEACHPIAARNLGLTPSALQVGF